MYKLKLVHEDGNVLIDKDVEVVILSFVETGVHVEARAFCDAEDGLSSPFIAGAIVAAQGVVEELYKDIPGMESLVSDCRVFCGSNAYTENPCSQGEGKKVEKDV